MLHIFKNIFSSDIMCHMEQIKRVWTSAFNNLKIRTTILHNQLN